MILLTVTDLLKVSLKLTLVQSAWTHTSMQSEGLLFALTPALKKIYGDQLNAKRILNHYKIPINTHPFLVAVLAGVILKMESEHRSTKTILGYVKTTMGPLAALGDPFFHGALAPFASISAALIALLFGPIPAIITLLVIFNTVHLAIRVSGLFIGYKRGEIAFNTLGKWIDNYKTSTLRTAASITGGTLIGLIIFRYSIMLNLEWTIILAGILCALIALALNMKRAVWVYVLPAFLLVILILEVTI
ncbi:MAG: PTS mannose/fructose/sorbose transporter family subunit IID [Deltaproteobacteria bacterium]|nr:PTS mannose/fructose/sorbose transporter family subunit IID [Deltaproteobacteria bacterium]